MDYDLIDRQFEAICEKVEADFQYPDDDAIDVVSICRIPSDLYMCGPYSEGFLREIDFWARRGIEPQTGDWSVNDHEASAVLYRFDGDTIVTVASVGD